MLMKEYRDNNRTDESMFGLFDDDNDDLLNFDEFMFLKHLGRNYSLGANSEIFLRMFDIDKAWVLDGELRKVQSRHL